MAAYDCENGDDDILKGKKIGLNQEKYLAMSKDERRKICADKKKLYANMISGNCVTQFDTQTMMTSCLSGRRLEVLTELNKHECQFACQP